MHHYTAEHRQELENLLASEQWRQVIDSGLVDEVKAARIAPGKLRPFIDTVVEQLLSFNEERVGSLIDGGHRDAERLLDELARWPEDLDGKEPAIAFLGLNLTSRCNFEPKCVYCNQQAVPERISIEGWKKIIAEATRDTAAGGPYIYITGGEPLLLGEAIWGGGGLVRFATERGAAVNINTNAVLITPEAALRLIQAGLHRLHISLDTCDASLQDELCSGERFQAILNGIYNIQIARELTGAAYPVIHLNCVLTNRNLDGFPQLFDFILSKHKQTADKSDPFFNDLFPHVIPVGGESNVHIRPNESGFRRFYERIWPAACRRWHEFQAKLGVPEGERGVLFGYFSNPFLRVEHRGELDAYAKASARGNYGGLALARHCYVAPTQAALTPDGLQFRCGSHAIRRILPTNTVHDIGLLDGIRRGTRELAALPDDEQCSGCALATLYINQSVEAKLKEKISAMLARESC